MLKCNDCGAVFDSDEVVRVYDDPSPAGVGLTSGAYEYWYCPHCDSDHLEEATCCPSCEEWHTGEHGTLCKDCAEDFHLAMEEIRNGMKLSQDDFEQVITEYFGW